MSKSMKDIAKGIQLEQLEHGHIYPVTIVMDRYTGAYSGAEWLAFQMDASNLPDEIGSDDGDESMFWRGHDQLKIPIGKGNTPNDALNDLVVRAKEFWENK